jgi:hypothetical protein
VAEKRLLVGGEALPDRLLLYNGINSLFGRALPAQPGFPQKITFAMI